MPPDWLPAALTWSMPNRPCGSPSGPQPAQADERFPRPCPHDRSKADLVVMTISSHWRPCQPLVAAVSGLPVCCAVTVQGAGRAGSALRQERMRREEALELVDSPSRGSCPTQQSCSQNAADRGLQSAAVSPHRCVTARNGQRLRRRVRRSRTVVCTAGRRRRRGRTRHFDRERGSPTEDAVHADGSAMSLDDLLRHRQP